MKRIIAIAVLSLAGLSAQAGVDLLFRGDYDNTPKVDNRSGTETPGSSIFRADAVKLDFNAKVGNSAVVGRLDAAFGPTEIVSGDNLVEHLFINHEIVSGLSGQLGKLIGQNGGFEREMSLSANTYLATLANGGIGGYNSTSQMAWTGAGPTAYYYTNVIPPNSTAQINGVTQYATPVASAGNQRGVALSYKMDENVFDLQVTNTTNHSSTSTYRRHNVGLYYSGSFMDKMIMPKIGYMSGSSDATSFSTTTFTYSYPGFEDTFMNLGVKMKFGMTGVIVENISNTRKASATGGKADTVTSTYVLVDHTIDSWKPFLKYEMSEFKSQDDATLAASFKRTGMGLGFEFTPGSEDFRYHLAYSTTSDKYGTAGAKETVAWSQLTAGIRYTADILK